MKRALLCVLAGGTAGAVASVAVPAALAEPRTQRETECRDITSGGARYDRDRMVDGLPLPPSDYPNELKKDSGRLRAHVGLATPSCAGVAYLLHVFRSDGSKITSRVVSGSSGESTLFYDVPLGGYAENCLAVQFETRVDTVTVDLAPDALSTYETVCDGFVSELVYR